MRITNVGTEIFANTISADPLSVLPTINAFLGKSVREVDAKEIRGRLLAVPTEIVLLDATANSDIANVGN